MEKKFASLKEKIAFEKTARAAKHESFAALYSKAQAVGFQAGETMTPHVMTVMDHTGAVIERVSEGMCGFASVIVRHANKGFGHWLITTGLARKPYYGGAEIWIHSHNQSYERKVAHAEAMVKLMRDAGIEAHVSSRLD